jgi:hypothetical protein
MTIAEMLRQIADAYDPDDEVDTFMVKAGNDPSPIFWPPLRREGGWVDLKRWLRA